MRTEHDLVVLGAGMAGTAAATKCASRGWDVAIVDALPYGGTCALRGCDPKKILRRGAEVVDSARALQGKGIDVGGLAVNWADLMAFKSGFTDPVPAAMESGLAEQGVLTLHDRARFTGPDRLDIGGTSHRAAHVLIATGARPRPLEFPGHEHLLDSTGFLDLPALPPRILFVGGGYISFEFAHIAARAGSAPVIVDRGARPLKAFDPDLVELLVTRSAAAGVELRRHTSITAVERNGSGYRVHVERSGEAGRPGRRDTLEVDLVVHGAGRTADLDGLDLEAAGVAAGPAGVTVTEHLQSTTNPAVFAAGDSADTPAPRLTPVAVTEAKVVASTLLSGSPRVPDYTGVPSVVFTLPELARVGMLEEEARAAGIDLDVRYADANGWYSTYRTGETTAATKVLVDSSTDLVVGAHLLGPEYSEVVNTFGLAMRLGLTTRQLKSAPAAYPTVGSDLASML